MGGQGSLGGAKVTPQTAYNSRRDAEKIGPITFPAPPFNNQLLNQPNQLLNGSRPMPKFNPSALPPVPVRRETKTFTACDGNTFDICVALSDGGEQAFAVWDLRDELWEKWQHGGPSTPGSAPVKISKTLCMLIARILAIQAPATGETEADLWQFPTWATLAQRDPKVFTEINTWVTELLTPEAPSPNQPAASPLDSGDGAAISSPPPLTTEVATPT